MQIPNDPVTVSGELTLTPLWRHEKARPGGEPQVRKPAVRCRKDRCLPQKAACLFAAVWFDCAHGDEQSRFPPESGIFLSTAQKRRIIMKKLVPLTSPSPWA